MQFDGVIRGKIKQLIAPRRCLRKYQPFPHCWFVVSKLESGLCRGRRVLIDLSAIWKLDASAPLA